MELELKRTSNISFRTPLSKYIAKNYDKKSKQDTVSKYEENFRRLDQWRQECVGCEISQSATEKYVKYYGQLELLQNTFVIDENNIKISFPWTTVLSKSKNISSYSLEFEKACILFNLAVVYSKLGDNESRTSEEGCKRACDFYQRAAGVFSLLLEKNVPRLILPPNTDLNPNAIHCFIKLMLAKGQECVLAKVILTDGKPTIISKLAASVGELYDEAFDSISGKEIADHFGLSFMYQLQGNALLNYATAHWHMAGVDLSNSKYGTELSRLNQIVSYADKALDQKKHYTGFLVSQLKNLKASAERELIRANKDNDLIYHDPIPDASSLPSVGRLRVAVVTPFPPFSSFKSLIGSPLFGDLVSVQIHSGIVEYNKQKDSLLKSISLAFSKVNSASDKVLSSLGLPGSIEASDEPVGVPESLISKSNEIKEQGGPESIATGIQSLDQLRNNCTALVSESKDILDKEEKEDVEMRRKYGKKWTRDKSCDLNTQIRAQIDKFSKSLSEVQTSDDKIKNTFKSQLPFIESLCLSIDGLKNAIPDSTESNSFMSNNKHVQSLKVLLVDLEAVKLELKTTLETIQEYGSQDDVSKDIGGVPESEIEELISGRLSHYIETQTKLEELKDRQNNLLERIKEENSLFVKSRKKGDETTRGRETAIQNLNDAYKCFNKLSGNLNEGVQFYMQLESHLSKLKESCIDFSVSRRFEFDDLLEEIDRIEKSNEIEPVKADEPKADEQSDPSPDHGNQANDRNSIHQSQYSQHYPYPNQSQPPQSYYSPSQSHPYYQSPYVQPSGPNIPQAYGQNPNYYGQNYPHPYAQNSHYHAPQQTSYPSQPASWSQPQKPQNSQISENSQKQSNAFTPPPSGTFDPSPWDPSMPVNFSTSKQ